MLFSEMHFLTSENNLILLIASRRRKKRAMNRGLHQCATSQLTLVEKVTLAAQINKYLKTIIVIGLSEVIVRIIPSQCQQ